MRNWIVLAFLTLASSALMAQIPAKSSIDLAIAKLEADAGLRHGTLSFMAVNMDNGQVIADHNADLSMIPASIQKLITTGVALERLGPNYQYTTTIQALFDEETGEVTGDLYVMPSGDPTLQSKYYARENSTLDKLKEDLSVIKTFTGSLIIDASGFSAHNTPRSWIWEDMGNYFGASPSALIWRDNLLKVYLNSGQVGTRAMLSSKTKISEDIDIDIEVTAAEGNRDDAWFFSAPGSDLIYAKGTIPSNRSNFLVKASHPKPMERFANELSNATGLKPKTIRIDHDYIEHANLNPIAKVVSPPMHSIVKMTNENSINIYAEALLVSLDGTDLGKSIEGGIKSIESILSKQSQMNGVRIIDGSGLSPLNRMTSRTMVDLLTMMYRSENKDYFVSSLPVAGKSGTLKNSFSHQKLAGNMKAKSGTMSGVRNYAGYITNSQGETIAFCVMLNNYDSNRRTAIMNRLEELMVSVADN